VIKVAHENDNSLDGEPGEPREI